jgi:hypothetical protein
MEALRGIARWFLAKGQAQKAAEATALVQSDAADLWSVTNAIKKAIQGREWLLDGRGQYLWDDQKYREESGLAFTEVLDLIGKVQPEAHRRFYEFMAADALQKRLDKSRAEGRTERLAEIVRWLDNEKLDSKLDAMTVTVLYVRLVAMLEDERKAAMKEAEVVYLRCGVDRRWPLDASGKPLE